MAAISLRRTWPSWTADREITQQAPRSADADAVDEATQAGQGRQGHRPASPAALHATEIAASQMSHGAGLRPGHGQYALRRREGPQRRHPPARPDPQSRRRADGRRLVQEIRRHQVRRRQHALALPHLRRATTTTATGTCSTWPRRGP